MKGTGGLYVSTYGMHQMHKLPADKWAILIKVNIAFYHVTALLTCGYRTIVKICLSFIEGATFCTNSCHGRSNLTIRFYGFKCNGTEEKLTNCTKGAFNGSCGEDVGIGCSKQSIHYSLLDHSSTIQLVEISVSSNSLSLGMILFLEGFHFSD